MKDSYYFSHDYNARNDLKLQSLFQDMGHEGIGIYWCLVELLYEQDGYLQVSECERIAFALRTDCEKLKKVVKIALKSDDENIWSDTILTRLQIRKEKSESARKSANLRWKDANAVRTQSDRNAIKERKGKENRIPIRKGMLRDEIELEEIDKGIEEMRKEL